MSIWYSATFHFKEQTNFPEGIVIAEAKKLGLVFNSSEYCEEHLKTQGLLVEVNIQNPDYDLVHQLTKNVIEHPSELCFWVRVNTHYTPKKSN